MSVSVLVVDDETDVAVLFRQHFRREVRQGFYVLHFACSAEQALDELENGIEPQLIVILSDINMPGMDGLASPTNRNSPPIRVMNSRGASWNASPPDRIDPSRLPLPCCRIGRAAPSPCASFLRKFTTIKLERTCR